MLTSEQVKTLYQNKDYESIVKLGDDPAFRTLTGVSFYYDWAYFKLFIANKKGYQEPHLIKTRQYVSRIIDSYKNDDLLFRLVIMKSVEASFDKPSYNAQSINALLDRVNPDTLNNVPQKYTDSTGKEREAASERERWYSWKSKCLEEMEDYHHCIEVCREGLSKLQSMHYDNQIWFSRRIALSLSKIGEPSEGLKILDELIPKKREWFLFSDRGFILIRMNEKRKGEDNLIQALNLPGPDQMKIRIYQYFLDNYKDGKYQEFNRVLKLYIIRIREKNEWPISDENKSFLEKLDPSLQKKSLYVLRETVMDFIRKEFKNSETTTTGVIGYIADNGRTGYIRPDFGDEIFFRTKNVINAKNGIFEKTRVKFEIVDSFDKSKNRESIEAINIQLIS